MTSFTAQPALRTATVVLGVTACLGAIVGIALVVRDSQVTKPRSCSAMAQAATDTTPGSTSQVNLIIGITGNSPAIAHEASSFVQTQLARSEATGQTIAKITLVNGDHEFLPAGADGDCVGRDLLIAPAASDLASYKNASTDSVADVAKSLKKQYADQVERVGSAIAGAVLHASKPNSGDAGTFDIWTYAGKVPTGTALSVLDVFSVGGSNCLTLPNPATRTYIGQTLIGSRVERCVKYGELRKASATRVSLVPASAVGLSGPQTIAQAAVVRALCTYATQTGCANQP